jgi:hypothetical protein
MSKRSLSGINIQFPWSQLLVNGKKQIETRSYPLPKKFEGVELAIIETPGKKGKANGIEKARIIGTITFSTSKLYPTKESWIRDKALHLVDENDPQFAYSKSKPKYGWIVASVTRLSSPIKPPSSRGIVFATGCKV